MSIERERPHPPDPFGGVMTFVYDSCGRLTSVEDGIDRGANERTAFHADAQAPRPEPVQPKPALPCLRHCFAFRMAGSETQEQTLALTEVSGAALIVAIERARVYLSGAAAPAGAIGGVEVHAVLDSGRVVCTAMVSDLPAGDLVVVEVDVAVYVRG